MAARSSDGRETPVLSPPQLIEADWCCVDDAKVDRRMSYGKRKGVMFSETHSGSTMSLRAS